MNTQPGYSQFEYYFDYKGWKSNLEYYLLEASDDRLEAAETVRLLTVAIHFLKNPSPVVGGTHARFLRRLACELEDLFRKAFDEASPESLEDVCQRCSQTRSRAIAGT